MPQVFTAILPRSRLRPALCPQAVERLSTGASLPPARFCSSCSSVGHAWVAGTHSRPSVGHSWWPLTQEPLRHSPCGAMCLGKNMHGLWGLFWFGF